jgi:glycosyltransferase involved in cell wall biosynthesis
MNICILAMTAPTDGRSGGAERQSWLLARGLTARGHRVLLLSTRVMADPRQREVVQGVEIGRLLPDGTREQRVKALAAVLRSHNADICYVRDFYWFSDSTTATQAVGTAVALNYYSLPQCGGLSTHILLHASKRLSPPSVARWFRDEREVARVNQSSAGRADARIVQTREQQDALGGHYGLSSCVIPNMQPITEANNTRPGCADVLWVGKTFKRPDVFLNLADVWASRGPDVRFAFACRIDQRSLRERSLVSRAARKPNVRVFVNASSDEIEALFASARVYLNTSLWEGFPNTFLEAWAAGTPVLSLSVDPDGVLERQGVGIACRGNRRKLENELDALVSHPERCEQMGLAARSYVALAHNPETIISEYENLFTEIIHR